MFIPSPDLLAERLRDWRLQQKVDLEDVALACKMPLKKLKDFENGQARLSVQEIENLLNYYGLTADQLLSEGPGWLKNAKNISLMVIIAILVLLSLSILAIYAINLRVFNATAIKPLSEHSRQAESEKIREMAPLLYSGDSKQEQPLQGEAKTPRKQALVMRFYGDALWEQTPPDVSGPSAPHVRVYTITALTARPSLPDWLNEYRQKTDRIILNLATNHALDAGRNGVRASLELLQKAGLTTLGLGTSNQCYQPLVVDSPQGRVGLLAFSAILPQAGWKAAPGNFGVAHAYEQNNVVAAVRAASAQVDLLVVLMHWGTTFAQQPAAGQLALAHRIIDAGADLIVGTHPLTVQQIERYRGKYIFYSLGHITSRYQSSQGCTMVVDVKVEDRDIAAVELQAGVLRRGRASFALSGTEKEVLNSYLVKLLPAERAGMSDGERSSPLLVR
ncbi:MAG: CapA family protein [Bacillota bacterium]